MTGAGLCTSLHSFPPHIFKLEAAFIETLRLCHCLPFQWVISLSDNVLSPLTNFEQLVPAQEMLTSCLL